jgi:hypothetical protein
VSLVEQVKAELESVAEHRTASEDFVRLSNFYDEMKRLGLSKKQEYALPLLDTVGRSLYSKVSTAKSRP